MKQKNLKESIGEHVNRQALSEVKLDRLMDLQNNVEEINPPHRVLQYRLVAAFSTVIIVLLTTLYFNLGPDKSLDERIGNEVALNHIKLKPLEIQSANLDVIREYFTELDFVPIESSLIKPSAKTLLGGRYCSIQGVTAAQLRFKDNQSGQIQSLYQTTYSADVFTNLPKLEEGQQPITVYSGGLEVDIWVEKGLLFALTREVQ